MWIKQLDIAAAVWGERPVRNNWRELSEWKVRKWRGVWLRRVEES